MYDNVSPTVLLYGLALVLAVSKALTLTIWRTMPRRRPGLRQEIRDTWQQRKERRLAERNAPPLLSAGVVDGEDGDDVEFGPTPAAV